MIISKKEVYTKIQYTCVQQLQYPGMSQRKNKRNREPLKYEMRQI